jgi:hypothetical protein
MTSVFIVRPFGKKSVPIRKAIEEISVEVDFDRIDRAVLQEVLKRNGLVGRTTDEIAEAGNIRFDMFQMLIAYDLVIADISIDYSSRRSSSALAISHLLRKPAVECSRTSRPTARRGRTRVVNLHGMTRLLGWRTSEPRLRKHRGWLLRRRST